MADILLEVCVDGIDGLWAAVEGGADRVELCAALELGGLTPSAGLMTQAAAAQLPIHVLIRPRPGGFCYSSREISGMLADILAARAAGLDGVVIGACDPGGHLETGVLAEMIAAAGPMTVTLHRVFDLVPDWSAALEQAIDLGFARVLTSGGAKTAAEGAGRLASMVKQARERIIIMPAGGIKDDNAAALLAAVPVRELHASCALAVPSRAAETAFGFAGPQQRATSVQKVRALKDVLRARQTTS